MTSSMLRTAAIALSLLAAPLAAQEAAAPADDAPGGLKLYLPRGLDVIGENLTVGDICIVRTADAKVREHVETISLGRTPLLGEAMVVDRRTVLSCLAGAGVTVDDVQFSGADRVELRRKARRIDSQQILAAARTVLPAAGGKGESQWEPAVRLRDQVVPAGGDLRLSAEVVGEPTDRYVRIEVAVLLNDRKLSAVPVPFEKVFFIRQTEAIKDVPAGTVMSADNCRVRTVRSEHPQSSDWREPFGLVAARDLRSGVAIEPAWLRPAQADRPRPAAPAPAVVRRGQNVLLQLTGDGWRIVATVEALQDGRLGEIIRVKNLDSGRTVTGRVQADGTLTPVLALES